MMHRRMPVVADCEVIELDENGTHGRITAQWIASHSAAIINKTKPARTAADCRSRLGKGRGIEALSKM